MIRATHLVGMAFSVGHPRCRMMAADIKEAAHFVVAAENNDNRFTGDLSRYIVAAFVELISPRGNLPRTAEDRFLFETKDAFVCIPRGRNRRGFGERGIRIVAFDDRVNRFASHCSSRLCRPMSGKPSAFRHDT